MSGFTPPPGMQAEIDRVTATMVEWFEVEAARFDDQDEITAMALLAASWIARIPVEPLAAALSFYAVREHRRRLAAGDAS